MTLLVLLWMGVPSTSAYAYVDPSVMTYTIQAVAGLVVALSAVIGVAFRRTRRLIYRVFHIDENANKVLEGEVSRIDPSSPSARLQLEAAEGDARSTSEACRERASSSVRQLSGKARFAFSLVACLFLAFTVFIAPAIEIFGANVDSLIFGLGSVWWIPLAFCVPCAVALAALVSLLNGRPFYLAVVVLFAIGAAAYVQSLFMNGGMMPADGGFIGWDEPYFVDKMVFSGAVWAVVLIGLPVLSLWRSHTWLKGVTAAACALIVVQAVGVGSVAAEYSQRSAAELGKPYVTQGDLLTVSPRSNVVEFVLDTYDTDILLRILEDDPGFLDDFRDFTFFPNSTGTMIPTSNAIPNMLTQQKPAPGQDIAEYRRGKYERSTYLRDIRDLGYSIGIYSDSLMMDYGNPADLETAGLTLNVHPVSRAPIDIPRTFVAMEQCALYREAPWVLKPRFWYYTSDVNNRMIADAGGPDGNDSLYELDDAAILAMVRERGLTPSDGSPGGAFRFIHLFGPHFPFSVDEDGNDVGTNRSDQIAQAKGSMRVVREYLDRLDGLGLYDGATIIVTADHGVWYLTDDPVSAPISPMILVKPARVPGPASERLPLAVSQAPVCHDDLQPTVIQAMGGDSARYGSTVFEVPPGPRERRFDALTSAGGDGQRFVEYAIDGDALDLGSWSKTGETWPDA